LTLDIREQWKVEPRLRTDQFGNVRHRCWGILALALGYEDNRVRANVLKALWESHDRPRMVTVLRDMARNDNRWMRASAAFVLQHIEVDGRLELLGLLAKDEFPEVYRHARRAIQTMNSLDCLPYWLEFLESDADIQVVARRIAESGFSALDVLLAYQPRNREEKRRIRLFLDSVEEQIFRDEGWISWLKSKHRRLFSG